MENDRADYEQMAYELGFIYQDADTIGAEGWRRGASAVLDYMIQHFEMPGENYLKCFEEGRKDFPASGYGEEE